MKRRTLIQLSVLLTIILSSCEIYYLPPQVQTPTHYEKGDLAINAQGLYTGSASLSYAFSDHGFIGLSGMGYRSQTDSLYNNYFRSTTVEGGFYHFDTIANHHFEIMGGAGFGRAADPSTNFLVDFNRFYFQPTATLISYTHSIENHFSIRFAQVQYKKQEAANVPSFNMRFIEPAYTIRAGLPNVKLHMQAGISIPVLDDVNRPAEFAWDPFIFGFGIQANLNIFGAKRDNF